MQDHTELHDQESRNLEIPDSLIEQAASNQKQDKKDNLNKRALTSGMFFVFAQLFARGLTLVATPFYTRMMTNAQYGIIRNYESWLMAAYTVMSLCLWRSEDVARQDYKDHYYEYTSSVHSLSYLSILFFTALMLIFKTPIQHFLEWNDIMFYFCPIYVLTYTSMLYLQRRDKQMLKYKLATASTLLTIVPGILISLFLIYYGIHHGMQDDVVNLRVIGYYTPQILGGAIIAVLIWKQGKTFFNKEYWIYGLKFSIPLIPEAESVQIMNLADKFMVQKLVGAAETGIFALPQTVSFIISILEDSVWNAWIPWLYEKIARDELEDVEKPWITMMHIFGLMSWVLVALAPEEIAILGDKTQYAASIYLIAPMVTGSLFRFYSYSYSAIQNYHKNTRWVAFGTISTMLLNVVLNYIFIVHINYQAAAYTTMISFIVLLFMQGYLEHRITGMVIVPLHKTVLIGVFYAVINMATMSIFNIPWYLRWLLIVVVGIVSLILLRERLLAVLSVFRKKKKA